MSELIELKSSKIAIVGDVMLDQYWWGSVNRISPEAPVPVIRHEKTTTAPGGAANVAVNIATLGAEPYLFGCVGSDDEATELASALLSKGVSPEYLLKVQQRRTIVKTRIIAHNQQVARVDREETAYLDEEDSQSLIEKFSAVLHKFELVVISDYAKGTLTPTVLSHVIRESGVAGKTVLVDPKGKDFAKYTGATILTPNRRESAEACKLDESLPMLTIAAGEDLLKTYGFPNVLITESEHGMTLFSQGTEPAHYDAEAHEVYDVTGAGDTVIATLGVALASGFDLPTAVQIANKAAGIAVGQIGTSAIDRKQLSDVINGLSKGVGRF